MFARVWNAALPWRFVLCCGLLTADVIFVWALQWLSGGTGRTRQPFGRHRLGPKVPALACWHHLMATCPPGLPSFCTCPCSYELPPMYNSNMLQASLAAWVGLGLKRKECKAACAGSLAARGLHATCPAGAAHLS